MSHPTPQFWSDFQILGGQVRFRCRLGGSVQGAWNKGRNRGWRNDPWSEASVSLKVMSVDGSEIRQKKPQPCGMKKDNKVYGNEWDKVPTLQ